MPRIGLQKPKYCPITITTEPGGAEKETYGAVKVFAKAVSADINITTSDVSFYADDALDEEVDEFVSGTITMEVDEIGNEVQADVTGAKYEQEAGTVLDSDTDSGKYVRFGFIVRRFRDNESSYRGVVLHKVKFRVPNESYQTKGESIAFNTDTMTGKIMRNVKHEYRLKSKWFQTETEAETWLDKALKPEEG